MRSWYPIEPRELDNKRLLAEHNEILIMARTIAGLSRGWLHHPETSRWRGHSKAMRRRHDELAEEMLKRGMKHKSPWSGSLINAQDTDDYPSTLWESLEVMREKLELKKMAELNSRPNNSLVRFHITRAIMAAKDKHDQYNAERFERLVKQRRVTHAEFEDVVTFLNKSKKDSL